MIQTDVRFTTTDKNLDRLYESAKGTLLSSLGDFGDKRLMTDAPGGNTATLNYSLMSAETLADYDLEVALDSVSAFLLTARKDGRLPSSLSREGGKILPRYDILTGFSFAEEALKLCYLAKNRNSLYSKRLYEALCLFDGYLWSKHDLNANGCLEIFDEADTEEGAASGRFPTISMIKNGEEHIASPFPVETYDLMGEAYCVRNTLSELALLLGMPEEAAAWQSKADAVKEKIGDFFWLGGFHACFDRDYRGSIISTLSINNLLLLYFGAIDTEMAQEIVQNHIQNSEEFRTPMPLPTLAANQSQYDASHEFCGPPRGAIYRRSIRAFEKYGYYASVTEIGRRLLQATGAQNQFPVCFDTVTGEPLNSETQGPHTPTASAVLEIIKRFWGVYTDRDAVCWGCLGHENATSEYRFIWGNDTYLTETEDGITTGSINGNRIFTVTAGTRVFTDIHGGSMRVVNATPEPLDCICVCRDRTYSMHLEPNEAKEIQ